MSTFIPKAVVPKAAHTAANMAMKKASKKQTSVAALPEFQDFRRVVASLQRDCKSQLETEQEAKEAFSFLNSQVKSLRAAFATLSDLVVEEVDNMRSELQKLREQQKLTLAELTEAARLQVESEERSKQMQQELLKLRSKVERDLMQDTQEVRYTTKAHDGLIKHIENRLRGLHSMVEEVKHGSTECDNRHLQDMDLIQSALEASQKGMKDLSRRCSRVEKDQPRGSPQTRRQAR